MHDDTDAPAEEPQAAEPPARLRVQFAAPTSAASPIHALRTGTFRDSMGRETTFTADDLRQIAERLNAGAQRRRPPINERHDYGRAVGRMASAYTRHGDNHLFITPTWNSEGQRLLGEEVYDAFSIELDQHPKGGWQAIGGALTNYPAVDGLKPVSLSAGETPAAVIDLPAGDVPADEPPTQESTPMPDETQAAPTADAAAPPAPPAMPAPPALNLSDPAVQTQLTQYTEQMQAYMRQQHEALMREAAERSRVEFERWKAEEGRRAALLTFAQHVTTPTMARPTAVAYSVEQVMDILTAPTPEKVRQILTDALDGALLVAAGVAGSSREGAEEGGQWDALVLSFQQQGMSTVDAIKAAGRKRPDLYRAANGRA